MSKRKIKENKRKINRGDFIFFYPRKKNLFQRIIAFFDGKYFHCGVALSENLIISMTIRGIKIQRIDNYRGYSYDVFYIEIDNEKKEHLLRFLISKMNEVVYDIKGIISFIILFISQNPRKFFCSEFLAWGLYYIGLTPEKLSLSPLQLSNQDFLTYKTKGVI